MVAPIWIAAGAAFVTTLPLLGPGFPREGDSGGGTEPCSGLLCGFWEPIRNFQRDAQNLLKVVIVLGVIVAIGSLFEIHINR